MAVRIPIISDFADKGIREAEKAFGKLGKTGAIVGAAFAASAALVVTGMTKSIAAAAEDQRSQELLAKQLENTVGASDKTTKATEAFIGQMELASGVADDVLRPALGNLVRATGDVTEAQDLLTLAQNISAGTGKDLESVSIALAKASLGQFTALGKLGIPLDENAKKTKDFSVIQATLDKQFGGASAAAADTFGGQLARLGTVWDNLTESIGYAVLNNEYVKDAIDRLPDAASNAIDAIGEKGLSGALGVFLDQMGIVGAYAKRFGIAVALAYNNMAMDAYNALVLLSVGFVQLIPGFVAAGKEVADNQLRLGLELDANTYYIQDLKTAMVAEAKQTKINATQSERYTQIAESMGREVSKTTGKIDDLGGATAKVKPKIKELSDGVKEMADQVEAASDALNDRLNKALETAKTNLDDAKTAFGNFGKSVSDSLTNAFSFKDAKDAGDETGGGFLKGLQDQAFKLQTYGYLITDLLRMGLSEDALQEVLKAGVDAGSGIAVELINGGADAINETNKLVEATKSAADIIGIEAANKFYAAGVANAQSYLDGVQATFTYAQTRLVAPNLTIGDIASIGAGFDSGITAPVLDPISRPDTNFGGPGGGVTVNVQGGISTSAEIGEAVVNAIRAYNRAAGPADIAVTR